MSRVGALQKALSFKVELITPIDTAILRKSILLRYLLPELGAEYLENEIDDLAQMAWARVEIRKEALS